MNRILLLAFLWLASAAGRPALAQTDGLPPRPEPFAFVNDQAHLLAPADAKRLESGLRRYADNTGTQVVVVTVPSLGGRSVADYGRALGTAWGVGQRDKNNGVVVLLGAQEHQVTIQPGNGLSNTITPAVTSRVIAEMTPAFKQGNYFAGLRAGLNTLMATANPSSDPRRQQPAAEAGASPYDGAASNQTGTRTETTTPAPAYDPSSAPAAEPASTGPGLGTLLLGALLVGGVLWWVVRKMRGSSTASNARNTPNFYPNQPNGPTFYPNQPNGPAGNYGPGYGNAPQSSGPGLGGILATGAAAAAGAYLGNRMASGHDASGSSLAGFDHTAPLDSGAAGAAGAGTGAASDYFSSRDGGGFSNDQDYFSDNNAAADNSTDYFSSDDNSSYDDPSSGDSGGGGFDSGSDNSGSW